MRKTLHKSKHTIRSALLSLKHRLSSPQQKLAIAIDQAIFGVKLNGTQLVWHDSRTG